MTHLYDRHCNADVSKNLAIYFFLIFRKLIIGKIRDEFYIRDNLFLDNVDKAKAVDGNG